MWSTPPCSQEALRTVHHRPIANTGPAPDAPSRYWMFECGRQHRQRVARPHDVAAERDREREADDVERGAAVHDERHEAQVVAERAQHRPETPESGIAASAVVAGVVVDADERSARGADHRSGRLPLEHRARSISSGIGRPARAGRSYGAFSHESARHRWHRLCRTGDRASRSRKRRHMPRRVRAHAPAAVALPGQLVDGDVRDRDALTRAADGVDAICHTAALVSIWRARRRSSTRSTSAGFENALDVCRARRIARLVYTSSFLALSARRA